MNISGRNELHNFKNKNPDATGALDSWEVLVQEENWSTPYDVVKRFPKATVVGGINLIFNICGNRYRLWVLVSFKNKNLIIKKIGTHKEYDKWNIK